MNWQQEQQAFWELITQPQDLREHANIIEQMFSAHVALSRVEALAIYNNAYHQRLIQISSELFPVLYHTLGLEVYTRLWLDYLAGHKPRPGPMSLLGEHLHEFAAQHKQFGKLPALLDIIKLESLLISLFDRADETAYTLAVLQLLRPEQWAHKKWKPKQDWALLQSLFDLEDYWAKMQTFLAQQDPKPGETSFAVQPVTDKQATWYLIRRVNHRMQFQRVNNDMATFLQCLQASEDFAGICEQLAREHPHEDVPALSLKLLLKAIELELIVAD
jgi:hypothetical protein